MRDGATPLHATTGEPPSRRLARLADWCLTGRLAAAELELHDWQRHAECPAPARALLAALLARRGEMRHALAVIDACPPRQYAQDPAIGQLHLAILAAMDLDAGVENAARRLRQEHAQDTAVSHWLASLDPALAPPPQEVPAAVVDHLAAELVCQPDAIPTLVAAQRLKPEPGSIALLRRGLGRAAPDLDAAGHGLVLCQAMSQLAFLAGDQDEARRWAHRGLRLQPYSAPLALLLALMRDDLSMGPAASHVLADAVAAQPAYPDLRAALIRRERDQGQPEAARQHLVEWLQTDAHSPLARQVEKELAA